MRYCPTTHYTVFARVYSYLDWINSNIEGSKSFRDFMLVFVEGQG
jgi:hypothetical protein